MVQGFFKQFEEESIFDPDEVEQWHTLGAWGDMNCADWLERHATSRPEQTAIVDDYRSITWGELNEAADRFAGTLVDLGVERGDRVTYQVSARIEWYVVRLGIAKAGAIATPLVPRFRRQEIEHVVTAVDPVVHVGMAAYKDYEHVAVVDDLRKEVDSLEQVYLIGDETDVPDWADHFEAATDGEPIAAEEIAERRIHPDYPDTLSTTSGTTGLPKIFYLVQNSRFKVAKDWESRESVTADDEILGLAPIQQATGEGWAYYVPLVSGATVVVTENRDQDAIWDLIVDRKPTMMAAIPTQMTKLVNNEGIPDDLSFFRCIPNAGAPLPPETAQRFEERGTVVLNMYGASDGGVPTGVCPVDPPELRRTTVGKLQPREEIRVVNANGEEIPRGEVGEILYWGPTRLFGYYDDRGKTEDAYGVGGPNEGWFHSNDAGVLDEDGNLTIVGRMDDMIIRGGQNIYPAEIENAILETGLVDEVAVVGMPDPEYGQRACAYVVADADLTLADIVDALDEQGLAKFKWPERLEHIEELPRSPGGKIRKMELEDDIEAKLEPE